MENGWGYRKPSLAYPWRLSKAHPRKNGRYLSQKLREHARTFIYLQPFETRSYHSGRWWLFQVGVHGYPDVLGKETLGTLRQVWDMDMHATLKGTGSLTHCLRMRVMLLINPSVTMHPFLQCVQTGLSFPCYNITWRDVDSWSWWHFITSYKYKPTCCEVISQFFRASQAQSFSKP